MISEKIEKKIYPNFPVMSPFDPRIVSDPYDPNVTFSPFNPFNEDFSDPRHDLYEYFYGDD